MTHHAKHQAQSRVINDELEIIITGGLHDGERATIEYEFAGQFRDGELRIYAVTLEGGTEIDPNEITERQRECIIEAIFES